MGLNSSGGPHAPTHENGGSDEVDATGLDGVGGGGGAAPSMQTHVYRNTNQTISTATLTAISFSTEVKDDDGAWAVSPNPTRITIVEDDTYDILGATTWDSSAAGTYRKIGIYKNGTLLHEHSTSPVAFMPQTVVSYAVALVATDYLELKVTHDSGSNRTLQSYTATTTYLAATRGGDESLLPLNDMSVLRGDAPYGFRQHSLDSLTTADVNMPGDGTIRLDTANATTSTQLFIGPGEIDLVTDELIFLEPGDVVVMDSGNGLVLPGLSSDPVSPYDESQLYYNTITRRLRMNRQPDGSNDVWQDLVSQGNAPHAFPVGWVPGGTYTTAVTLPANGGSLAVPILVPAPMVLTQVDLWNTDTTLAREFEMDLYFDKWTSVTALHVQGSSGSGSYNFGSWTASGAAIQSAAYGSSSPVWLEAGVVWLVIRNSHATNTLGVGTLASSGTFSALNSHQTKTLGSFLDTTLDLVTGWSKATAIPGVVLRGKVLAQSGAW